MRNENLRRGALLMLAASLMFAAAGATVKHVSQFLPNEIIVFFRNLVGLLILTPWFAGRGLRYLATRHPRGHLLRALTGVIAMYCYFYAIGRIPLAEAILLNYTAPLFIPLIAMLWLAEPVGRRLWGPILIGFAGVALILKPGASLFTPVAVIGLAAGLFSALSMVGIRRLTATEPATRVVFYFSLFSTAVSAVPLAWRWVPPGSELWLPLFMIALFSTAGQILMTRAYSYAPAGQVGPFLYAIVVFAGLLGWALWSEIPDGFSLAGAVVVAAAGILSIRLGGRPASAVPETPVGETR